MSTNQRKLETYLAGNLEAARIILSDISRADIQRTPAPGAPPATEPGAISGATA